MRQRQDIKYPLIEAIDSVLIKLGIDPSTRYHENDQDREYTTCKLEELEQYIELYFQSNTTEQEKRVLGCYFLECLNDFVQDYGKKHHRQDMVFEILHKDIEIHESELNYWSDTSNKREDNWWPITKYIIDWRNT